MTFCFYWYRDADRPENVPTCPALGRLEGQWHRLEEIRRLTNPEDNAHCITRRDDTMNLSTRTLSVPWRLITFVTVMDSFGAHTKTTDIRRPLVHQYRYYLDQWYSFFRATKRWRGVIVETILTLDFLLIVNHPSEPNTQL